VEPDEVWKKMKEVYDSCIKANVEIPKIVNDYFNRDIPHDKGVKIEIEVERPEGDMEDIFRIDLKNIRKDIRYIDFINSY